MASASILRASCCIAALLIFTDDTAGGSCPLWEARDFSFMCYNNHNVHHQCMQAVSLLTALFFTQKCHKLAQAHTVYKQKQKNVLNKHKRERLKKLAWMYLGLALVMDRMSFSITALEPIHNYKANYTHSSAPSLSTRGVTAWTQIIYSYSQGCL